MLLLPLLLFLPATRGDADPASVVVRYERAVANLEYANEPLTQIPTPDVNRAPAVRPDHWYGTVPFAASSDTGEETTRLVRFLARYEGASAAAAWVDTDADGDLEEESATALSEYTLAPGARSVFVHPNGAPIAAAIATKDPLLVRVVLDPASEGRAPSYRLQRVFAPIGSMKLEGESRLAVLWDGNLDGRFTDAYGDGIFVDIDGNRRIDVDPMSIEFGPFAVPFSLGAHRFRATPIGADGAAIAWTDLGPAAPRVVVTPGVPAPSVDLWDAAGREIDRGDWPGHPVLLHFWASWCGTCSAQLPALQALYADARPRGLRIVGVSFDRTRPIFDAFITSHAIPWPNTFEGRQFWENSAAAAFQVRGAGGMILIAPDGTVDGKYTDVAAVRKRVDELLNLSSGTEPARGASAPTGGWRLR